MSDIEDMLADAIHEQRCLEIVLGSTCTCYRFYGDGDYVLAHAIEIKLREWGLIG